MVRTGVPSTVGNVGEHRDDQGDSLDALVSFLRARMDEHWRGALAAGASSAARTWSARSGRVESADGETVAPTSGEGGPGERARSEHIVRNDPAHALRRLESTRRLIERYELLHADLVEHPEGEALLREYEEVVLPLLALPFSDHPDHRPQWSPREESSRR